jgi:hypothetical protein
MVGLGERLGAAAVERKTRPRTALAVWSSAALVLLAFASMPTSAAASTRTFKLIFEGGQQADYTAADSTPFDIQRAGYSGCTYSQKGETEMNWWNAWKVTAKVNGDHVKITNVKHTEGPSQIGGGIHTDGSSQIKGSNGDASPSTQCSGSGRAGAYNCNATKLTVKLGHHAARFAHDPNAKNAFLVTVPGFDDASASYSGNAPSKFTCKNNLGTNLFPGGFVSDAFGGTNYAQVKMSEKDIASLKDHDPTQDRITEALTNKSPDWLLAPPDPGSSCAVASDTDGTCHYTKSLHGAQFIFRRVS